MQENIVMKEVPSDLVKKLLREGTRSTVIVGAGLSIPAAQSTDNLRNMILEFEESEVEKEIFDTHARIHFGKNNSDKCTLEELFSIYAKVKYNEERSVYDFLVEHDIPGKESEVMPPIGCELLAHLLQHGLVKNIISMNFDELLEISLDDEMGEGAYRWIKSLSEFDALSDPDEDIWLNKPNLIKVHGTISRPLTLRPTVETVQRFEDAKANILKRILDETHILILIGYSCSDQDFREVLFRSIRERGDKKPFVYWVDADDGFHLNNTSFQEMLSEYTRHGIKEYPILVNMSSSDFLKQLSHLIYDEDKTIHDISRHLIRENILGNSSQNHLQMSRKKFLLETIVHAVRAKGMFGINAIAQSRRMSNCCKRLMLKSNAEKLWYLFDNLVDHKILCKHEGLNEIYYFHERLGELNILSDKIYKFFGIVPSDKDDACILNFSQLLRALIEESDVDIGLPEEQLFLEFRDPVFITTQRELKKCTLDIIAEGGKRIRIIAHTGEWLTREGIKEKVIEFINREGIESSVELIICEETIPDAKMHNERARDILNILMDKIGIKPDSIYYLPWNKHTFHMLLGHKGGIYFARSGKSPTITPVLIRQPDDLNKLSKAYEKLKNEAIKGRCNSCQSWNMKVRDSTYLCQECGNTQIFHEED